MGCGVGVAVAVAVVRAEEESGIAQLVSASNETNTRLDLKNSRACDIPRQREVNGSMVSNPPNGECGGHDGIRTSHTQPQPSYL